MTIFLYDTYLLLLRKQEVGEERSGVGKTEIVEEAMIVAKPIATVSFLLEYFKVLRYS